MACSICQTETETQEFTSREVFSENNKTWNLCYICANTHIGSSEKAMYNTQNRIMGAIGNILLDAIVTGKDPRVGWATSDEEE